MAKLVCVWSAQCRTLNHAPGKSKLVQLENTAFDFLVVQGLWFHALFVILPHVALGTHPATKGPIQLVFGRNMAIPVPSFKLAKFFELFVPCGLAFGFGPIIRKKNILLESATTLAINQAQTYHSNSIRCRRSILRRVMLLRMPSKLAFISILCLFTQIPKAWLGGYCCGTLAKGKRNKYG